MNTSLNFPKHGRASLLFVCSVFASAAASAQTGFYIVPSIAIQQAYDDNLFFTIDDEKADWITRVTPALDAGYESEQLRWGGRYSVDAESYRENSTLDSWQNRRVADLFFNYDPNSRLTLAAIASYTKTVTPLDLTLAGGTAVQGFLVGRTPAERLVIQPSIGYRLTPDTEAEFTYTQTNDKLDGGIESDTQMAELGFETQLSQVNMFSYGYIFRNYEFESPFLLPTDPINPEDNINPDDAQDSHTAYVGGSHAFNPRTTLSARVGPRYYNDNVDPYVLLNLRRQNPNGMLDLSYEHNETTLLGEVGRVDSETLTGSYTHNFGPNFEIQISPSAAQVAQTEFEVDIYRIGMDARYRVNDVLSFIASYNLNHQRIDFDDGRLERVSRNFVMVGFLLTYPRRTEQNPQQ